MLPNLNEHRTRRHINIMTKDRWVDRLKYIPVTIAACLSRNAVGISWTCGKPRLRKGNGSTTGYGYSASVEYKTATTEKGLKATDLR
jgi:hypothetical protein